MATMGDFVFYRFWSIRHAESERMYMFVMGSIAGDCYQITAPYLQLCEAKIRFRHINLITNIRTSF